MDPTFSHNLKLTAVIISILRNSKPEGADGVGVMGGGGGTGSLLR